MALCGPFDVYRIWIEPPGPAGGNGPQPGPHRTREGARSVALLGLFASVGWGFEMISPRKNMGELWLSPVDLSGDF